LPARLWAAVFDICPEECPFPGNIVRMRRNLQGSLRFRVYL
jgi:hypothetical protein